MSDAPRRRIEAALRIANDPRTLDADRAAAVNGARRLIEAAGLAEGDFDFPGRPAKPPPPRSRFRADLFERAHSPFFDRTYTSEDIVDVMERFARHLREEVEVERRAAEVERDQAASADVAVDWLWREGVKVYRASDAAGNPYGSRRWIAPGEAGHEFSDEGIVEVAVRRGFRP